MLILWGGIVGIVATKVLFLLLHTHIVRALVIATLETRKLVEIRNGTSHTYGNNSNAKRKTDKRQQNSMRKRQQNSMQKI